MTKDFFNSQMGRLKLRFGERAFDPEFQSLIAKEVSNMRDYEFTKLVETMIGARKHSNPPTIVDFREMRVQVEKDAFNRDLDGASRALNAPRGSLRAYLENNHPGCKTLWEAVEAEVKIRAELRANGIEPEGVT